MHPVCVAFGEASGWPSVSETMMATMTTAMTMTTVAATTKFKTTVWS